MTHALVVVGAPRTKKTHNVVARVRGRPVVLPSAAWRRWVKSCLITVLPTTGRGERVFLGLQPLTTRPVSCRALFYQDAARGDAVGYYQGLADLLERRGVIANDAQIADWDGSRLLVDRGQPRVEVVLTELDGPAAASAAPNLPSETMAVAE